MGGKRKKCRKERVGSVAANPDNLGSNKEAGRGAQGSRAGSTRKQGGEHKEAGRGAQGSRAGSTRCSGLK